MDEFEHELELVEDHPQTPDRSGVGGFLVGLVVGAAIGAGVAVLATPRKGKTMRNRLRRQLKAIGAEARDRADEWREDAGRRLRRARRRRRS